MIFPFNTFKNLKTTWFWRSPLDPAQHIDRVIADRSYRLAIGLSLSECLQTVHGCLLVTQGNGKYLRLKQSVSASREIPQPLTNELKRVASIAEPSLQDLSAITADLAQIQYSLVEELKSHAGRYVDRLLIVACDDPGLWLRDIDQQTVYQPICDPVSLAEMCGITVVDSFPTRDIASRGNGKGIHTLPHWLLLADRAEKVARNDSVVFAIGDKSTATYLPASDGLDSEIPEIRTAHGPGLSLLRSIAAAGRHVSDAQLVQLNIDGHVNEDFLLKLKTVTQDNSQVFLSELRSSNLSAADIVRTGVVFMIDSISSSIQQSIAEAKKVARNTPGIYRESDNPKIQVDCSTELAGIFINQIQRQWPDCNVTALDHVGLTSNYLAAASTAILGLLFVDQMPANIPRITGADSQRILGRVTPGKPSNWRLLLCEMADFQPPAMRLRDAV